MSADQTDIIRIAEEIKRYLHTHPNAADSRDGVMRWWLARQRYEETVTKVQRALDYLEQVGVVKKKQLGDGQVLYTGAKHDSDLTH